MRGWDARQCMLRPILRVRATCRGPEGPWDTTTTQTIASASPATTLHGHAQLRSYVPHPCLLMCLQRHLTGTAHSSSAQVYGSSTVGVRGRVLYICIPFPIILRSTLASTNEQTVISEMRFVGLYVDHTGAVVRTIVARGRAQHWLSFHFCVLSFVRVFCSARSCIKSDGM
jgi:hypothetical protein